MIGLMRYLYEATNLINDHVAAANFYADRFGLDASRFVPIKSKQYGYDGQLTMFNPPERLDRIELSHITDDTRPMGRFMTRRGGETLYMCYIEAEEIAPIVQRLDKRGMRYAGRDPQSPNPEGIFLHPSTLHGVLMGCSRTNLAWVWSGHPELAGVAAADVGGALTQRGYSVRLQQRPQILRSQRRGVVHELVEAPKVRKPADRVVCDRRAQCGCESLSSDHAIRTVVVQPRRSL